MKKIFIMSVAVMGSLVCGEALLAMVLVFVMISGLMAGCFMNESSRQLVECPSRVLRLAPKKKQEIPVEG